MNLIAIEWNDDGSHIRWTNGRRHRTSDSLSALADSLSTPHGVLCQPAFFGWNRQERDLCADVLAISGHQLIPVTPQAREVLAEAADSVEDGLAGLLLQVKQGSERLDRHIAADFDWHQVRDALHVAHAVAVVAQAWESAGLAAHALGPYQSLDKSMQLALGDGSGYLPALLDAIWRAAMVSTDRPTFERMLSLTAMPARGSMGKTMAGWYERRNTTAAGFKRESVLTWSAYRRALRWAFHAIKRGRVSETQCAA